MGSRGRGGGSPGVTIPIPGSAPGPPARDQRGRWTEIRQRQWSNYWARFAVGRLWFGVLDHFSIVLAKVVRAVGAGTGVGWVHGGCMLGRGTLRLGKLARRWPEVLT